MPVRLWVLTVQHGLRYVMAHDPVLTSPVLRAFLASVSWGLRKRARRLGVRGLLKTGAVTVIQRFDSTLGLNVHFHSLVIDGVYARDRRGRAELHAVAAPNDVEVAEVAGRIYARAAKLVDEEDEALAREPLMAALTCASLRRRAATGPRRGRPIRRLGSESCRRCLFTGVGAPRSRASTCTRTSEWGPTIAEVWSRCVGTSRGHRCRSVCGSDQTGRYRCG